MDQRDTETVMLWFATECAATDLCSGDYDNGFAIVSTRELAEALKWDEKRTYRACAALHKAGKLGKQEQREDVRTRRGTGRKSSVGYALWEYHYPANHVHLPPIE